jgi:hypothetical protein
MMKHDGLALALILVEDLGAAFGRGVGHMAVPILVPRIRSSHHFAGPSLANFGFE